MATKAKASTAPEAEAQPVTADPHDGPARDHDWRNPDAKFAADDHCVNAEMRRLAERQGKATA